MHRAAQLALFSIAFSGVYAAPCPAGSYSTTGADPCTPCSLGSYSAASGSTVCTTCPQGTYSVGTGATACELCMAGTASTASGASTVCTAQRNLTWLFKDPVNNFYYLNLPRVQNAAYHVGPYGQTTYRYSKVRIQSRLALNMSKIQLYVRYFDKPTSTCSSTNYDYKYGTGPTAVEFGGIVTASKTANILLNLRNSSFGLFNGINSWGTACSTSVSSFVRNCLDPQYCTLSMYAASGNAHFTGILSVLNATSFDADVYTACILNASDPLLQCNGNEAWCPSPCTGCQPGYYAPNAGATQCTPCPMGSFTSKGKSSACTSCPVGTWSATTGTTMCTPCVAGTYADSPGSTVCVSCPAGSASNSSGTSTCALCPAGTYSPSPGATVCTACPLGKYADTPGQTQCTCPPGTYVTGTTCTPCDAGKYSTSADATACAKCTYGKFAASSGSSVCTDCSPGTSTRNLNGQTACVPCSAGYYANLAGLADCRSCATDGATMYCPSIGMVQASFCPTGQYGLPYPLATYCA